MASSFPHPGLPRHGLPMAGRGDAIEKRLQAILAVSAASLFFVFISSMVQLTTFWRRNKIRLHITPKNQQQQPLSWPQSPYPLSDVEQNPGYQPQIPHRHMTQTAPATPEPAQKPPAAAVEARPSSPSHDLLYQPPN